MLINAALELEDENIDDFYLNANDDFKQIYGCITRVEEEIERMRIEADATTTEHVVNEWIRKERIRIRTYNRKKRE